MKKLMAVALTLITVLLLGATASAQNNVWVEVVRAVVSDVAENGSMHGYVLGQPDYYVGFGGTSENPYTLDSEGEPYQLGSVVLVVFVNEQYTDGSYDTIHRYNRILFHLSEEAVTDYSLVAAMTFIEEVNNA